MYLMSEEIDRSKISIRWCKIIRLLTYSEMLLRTWFVTGLMFTTAKQSLSRKSIRSPNRQKLDRVPFTQSHYGSLKTGTGNKINSLLLITLNPNWTTIKSKMARRKFPRTSVFIRQTKRRQLLTKSIIPAANKNLFIELDTETPFIPKKITMPGKPVSTTVNHKNYTFENGSVIHSTDLDYIDENVLTRIQQLETELKSMQVQVKKDTITIEKLKSRVSEKNQEIAELNFTYEPLFKNNTNKATTLLYIEEQFTTKGGFTKKNRTKNISQRVIKYKESAIKNHIDKEETTTGHNGIELTQNNDIYVNKFRKNTRKNRDMNSSSGNNVIPSKVTESTFKDFEIDQANDDIAVANRRHFENDYKEVPTHKDLPDERFTNINDEGQLVYNNDDDIKKDIVLDSQEYRKKLEEERIEKSIDWKNFNPNTFLAQLSAELKEKTKLYPMNLEMLTMMPFSGRRMFSDKGINITRREYPQLKIPYAAATTTKNMLAPAPPRQRKLVLATDVPIAVYDGFNVEDSIKPDIDYFPNPEPKPLEDIPKIQEHKRNMRPLAPQAGKQKLVLDSTEALVKKVLGRLSLGKSHIPPSLDFDVFRQKLHRDGGKQRKKLHEEVAKRLSTHLSGRRNMDPIKKDYGHYLSNEILRDPFLNDSLI